VSHPWLSVIIPTYNGATYLGDTLASIARQGDDGLEVIAVDDGSSDATPAILDAYARHHPLRLFLRPRVGNWVANSNYGLSVARGDYACFLHQDDVWLPGRLEVLRRLVSREPDATLFLHPSHYMDRRGRQVGVWKCPLPSGKQQPAGVVERLLVQNFIAMPAPLFARAAALRAGGMDEALWYTADWDFWLRLAAAGPSVYYPRPLAAFRIHALSQTARGVNRADEMRQQIERVLERHLSLWEACHRGRPDVGRVARAAVEVNHALACCAYGRRPKWLALALHLVALGPAGWWRFLRDSRLLERVSARLRAGLVSELDRAGLHFRAAG
jgi:GT2 family glycosyltransferase